MWHHLTGSTQTADIALARRPARPTRTPYGLIKRVLWGCAVLVVASIFAWQCALADLAPPPGKPKPPRPKPKPDPPSQSSPGPSSGFPSQGTLFGAGCVVGSVELLAIAGLIASRRRRKDETASDDSRAGSVVLGPLTDTHHDDNR